MVLLVVDVQKGIVNDRLYEGNRFILNVKKLIDQAHQKNVEIIYLRHDDGQGELLHPGNPEYEIDESICVKPDEKIFDKIHNSSFFDTGLDEYLKGKGEDTIIICGLQSEYCIDATIKSGYKRGYQMIVPDGANTTVDHEYMSGKDTVQFFTRLIWDGRYGKCVSMDHALSIM